uniref:mannose-6-phosphate isomerase n=1 Tax=Globodera pallida TaxID=36090 RepID=A0A183BU46_GLOPA
MQRLECAVQHYAWGKTGQDSFIARLLPAERVDAKKRYAELWMGTHPNGPSRVVGLDGGGETNLRDFLARNPTLLGEHEEGELRFLFKVLSVDKALSIQSHPTKEQAKLLHANDPKNYPDDNHKPEMAIALTEFELLCGFQLPHGIISNMKAHRELLQLVDDESLLDELAQTEHDAKRGREALRQIFCKVWTSSAERIAQVVVQIVDRLDKKTDRAPVDELVLRLNNQFPGGDIGVLAPFFLNFFTLQPGQATFLGPNEPHAYLSGDCVECMALSDNTIRAGLTPKFKDVPTLCSSLTYRMYAPPIFEPKKLADGVTEYAPSVEEFAVHKIESKVSTLRPISAGSILIVVAGSAILLEVDEKQQHERQIVLGDVLFLTKDLNASLRDTSSDFLAFRSFTPSPPHFAK